MCWRSAGRTSRAAPTISPGSSPTRPVPPARVLEVGERIGAGGVVIEPLDEASVRTAAEACRALGVEAVAVCLLHSFANPAHERRVAEILRESLPGVAVTASSDVLPVVREYERSLATVFNAVVMPGVSTYVVATRTPPRRGEGRARRSCSCSRTAASRVVPPSGAPRRSPPCRGRRPASSARATSPRPAASATSSRSISAAPAPTSAW